MHDTEFDHDHEELYARSADIEGLERLTLISVGIDIGSSTTHLLFSRLTLRREGAAFSTRFSVSERELLWSSPILLTPYLSQTRIDFEKIRAFIEACYRQAGFSPDGIDSGAVVITGEALKKENAQPIAEYFAQGSGKFVCASAGPRHEALLAAYGSGAVGISRLSRSRVLNIDIGGGTTKLTLIRNGEIAQSSAISIGARLIAFDEAGKVSRLEEAGKCFAEAAAIPLALGTALGDEARTRIADLMAQTLQSVLVPDGATTLASRLWVSPPFAIDLEALDYVVFSGGVAEYIHNYSDIAFGDLGPALGAALRVFAAGLPAGMVMEPAQSIRATVIGASSYSIQVSGSTSFAAGAAALPLHGLKVVPLRHGAGTDFRENLAAALRKFDIPAFGSGLLISISIEGDIDYAILREIAAGLAEAAAADPASPLIVNVEQDVGQSLGNILHGEFRLPNPLIAIDGIAVGDLDYVDIGAPLGMTGVFPVTVKSLLFSSQPLL